MIVKLLFLFSLSLLLSSCAGYVNKMHRDMDAENGIYTKRKSNDPFSAYRKRKPTTGQEMVSPKAYSTLSTRDENEVSPKTKRAYNTNLTKRHNTNDLTDQSDGGSLWSSQQENFLFAKNKSMKVGGIILVKVLEKLRNDISSELKRSFPTVQPRKEKAKTELDKKTGQPVAAAPAKEELVVKEKEAPDENVYDSISSIIVEDVNNDYVLLRGKKEVLYKKEKHLLEVQALVNKRDITDDDAVLSDKIIESSITILR